MRSFTLLIPATMLTLLSAAAIAQDSPLGALGKMDKDGDGKVSEAEFIADRPMVFRRLDANKDKSLTIEEITTFYLTTGAADDPKVIRRIDSVKNADANADGSVTLEELSAFGSADFKKRDQDGDGFITAEDVKK